MAPRLPALNVSMPRPLVLLGIAARSTVAVNATQPSDRDTPFFTSARSSECAANTKEHTHVKRKRAVGGVVSVVDEDG